MNMTDGLCPRQRTTSLIARVTNYSAVIEDLMLSSAFCPHQVRAGKKIFLCFADANSWKERLRYASSFYDDTSLPWSGFVWVRCECKVTSRSNARWVLLWGISSTAIPVLTWS